MSIDDLIELANQGASDAIEQARIKKIEYEQANHIQKIMEEIANYTKNGWVLHVLSIFDKKKTLIENLRAKNHPVSALLDRVKEITLEKAKEVASCRFPAYMEEACCNSNLLLDKNSAHPCYRFDNGFFTVEIDEKKWIAKLSNYETKGKLAELPADPTAIVEAVKKEHNRVFERSFEPKAFLKQLRQAYLTALKDQKRADGSSIPIRDVVKRFGEKQPKFYSDEFLIDLSRLVEKGVSEIDKRNLELQQAQQDSTEAGVLLLGGRGYVGFVMFKEVR